MYRTTNYGKSWERIVDAKDVSSYALSIIQDPVARNLFFLGTDDGLYISIDGAASWEKMDSKLFPTVSTKDLVIHPREPDLIIGTFGRAAWVLDDIEPLRQLAQNPDLLKKDVVLFDAPTAYHAASQQPTGTRFGGDALYNGENRPEGAQFTFYIKAQKPVAEKERLKLTFYKDEVLIKELERKAPDTSGFYRWTWDLTEESVDRPERFKEEEKQDVDDIERSGKPALPGTYEVTLSHGDFQSKATIKVALDPRVEDSEAAFKERYQALKSLEEMTALAAAAVSQVQESRKEVIALIKTLADSKAIKEVRV